MNAPQPHKTINCQQVLSDGNCTHGGWLRKRTAVHQKIKITNKIFPWTNMYVCLCQGCVYLFSSDTASKPQNPFSLHGYDRILQAGEILQKDVPWPFKIEPVNSKNVERPKKVRYFSAASEREQKVWMTEFKKQMMFANGKGLKVSHCFHDDADSVTLSAVQESVYDDADDFRPADQAGEDSDSGEEYDSIDDWDAQNTQTNSNAASRRDRPLPSPPGAEPKTRQRKQSSDAITTRSRLPSSPTSASTSGGGAASKQPLRSFGSPPSRRQELPPPPPNDPPEDSPPPTPGNVNSRISAFENINQSSKPEVSPKPRLNVKFGVKLPSFKLGAQSALKSPTGAQSALKSPTGAQSALKSPKTSSPEADVDRSQGLPVPAARNRKHKPLPSPPALGERGKGDGINNEESEEEFINSIYFPDLTKEEANRLVSEMREDGLFLLRAGSNNSYVLVVFAEGAARMYKVFKIGGKVHLVSTVQFASIRELIEHYKENDIPLRNTPLTRAYYR